MRMMNALRRAMPAVLFLAASLPARSSVCAEEGADFRKEIDALIPGLASTDPGQLSGAQKELEKLCLAAGRPGAERERKAVARALAAKLGPEVSAGARVRLVRQLQSIGREESVAALAPLLKESDPPDLREAARRALEANPAPQAVRALRQAYAGARGDFRAALIRSLGARRDSLCVGQLLDDARSEEAAVALAALDALAEIGDRSGVDAFEEALQKGGPEAGRVRKGYLRLAETMGEGDEGGAARRIYLQALQWGPAERFAALVGLGRAGIPADARVLVEALSDPDPGVRGAARDGLAAMRGGVKAIEERIERASPELRKEFAAILGRREDAAAGPILLGLAKDPSPAVRVAAIEALGKTPGGEAARTALKEALSSGSADEREAAERALESLRGPKGAGRVGVQLYIWTQHFGGKGQKVEDHLEETFEKCRAAGFGAVQGWLSFYDGPEGAAKVAALLAKHGLAMPAAYTGGHMHTEAGAKGAIEGILRQAKIGKQHGLEVVIMNPDGVGREKTEEELGVQAKSLDRLGGELRALGLRLAIHTHDPEMRSGAREWYHMLRNTDPEKVGFCLDLHWVFRGKQDPYKLLADAGKRTLDLHLRNSTGGVWSEDFGEGEIDHRRIKAILDGIPYRGLFTVELAYEGGTKVTRSLEEDLRRSREYVRAVFGE